MEAKVRPAKPEDKAPLMSFIRDVWGGQDYIPFVWDQWLRNKQGRMFVVEADGTPVGMNRVRFLEDGSAWFEGARVHPGFRGRGLASMLGENSMRFAVARGVRVFRLTSGSRNDAAHRQIWRMGFREAARFSVYEPPKGRTPSPTGRATRMDSGEVGTVMRLLRRAKEFRLGGGVFWHDFTATLLSKDVVSGLLAEGAVWRAGDALAVARIGSEGEGHWEEVCYVGGPAQDSIKLVKALVGRGRGVTERFVFVPQRSPIIAGLRKEGYGRNFSMILFERRATNG
jgi:ribosomal protein S18 acetylase RimI-like enzyme